MSEQTPSWAERLISSNEALSKSNQALADAITFQAKSINALSGAIAQMVAAEIGDEPQPLTYMDGTPR